MEYKFKVLSDKFKSLSDKPWLARSIRQIQSSIRQPSSNLHPTSQSSIHQIQSKGQLRPTKSNTHASSNFKVFRQVQSSIDKRNLQQTWHRTQKQLIKESSDDCVNNVHAVMSDKIICNDACESRRVRQTHQTWKTNWPTNADFLKKKSRSNHSWSGGTSKKMMWWCTGA